MNGACVFTNTNEGGTCSDGTEGEECGTNGKCKSGACTFDSTATNGESCTPESKCVQNASCQNGQCKGTPIDVSTWTDNASLVNQLNFPEELTSGIASWLSTATGGNILLDGFNISGKGQSKNCCDEKTGPVDGGESEASGSGQLGAHIKGLPLGWAIPEIFKIVTIPFTSEQLQLDITFGLYFGADITLNGELGYRQNLCEPGNDCTFAQADISLEPSIYLQGGVTGCASIYTPLDECIGGQLSGGVKITFSGGARYHKPDCNTGIQGFVSVSQPVLFATAQAMFLGFKYSWSFQYTLKFIPSLVCSLPGGCHTEP